MEDSIRLGRIAGIQIGFNWSLLIVFALLTWTLGGGYYPSAAPGSPRAVYWLASGATALLFFASLLAHEMGHAVVARRLGVAVEGITLWLFGGVARLRGEAATPWAEARIALAGPIVSFLLAAAFAGCGAALDFAGGPDLLTAMAIWLAFTNVVLGVFNLVPAFPLDGGRVLRAILWRRGGDRYRATARAARIGRVFGYLVIAFGIVQFFFGGSQGGLGALWSVFLGWFLLTAARSEESHVLLRGALGGVLVSDVMSPDPITAPSWITLEEFVRSYAQRYTFSTFPLRSFEGAADGLIVVSRVQSISSEEHRSTRVKDVACTLAEVGTARPHEAVSELLDRMADCGGRVLVMEAGVLVGIVSPRDVTRALRIAALRGAAMPSVVR